MKTYIFRVVVEPDEDRWSARCPALEQYAATTWFYNQERPHQALGYQTPAEVYFSNLVVKSAYTEIREGVLV